MKGGVVRLRVNTCLHAHAKAVFLEACVNTTVPRRPVKDAGAPIATTNQLFVRKTGTL